MALTLALALGPGLARAAWPGLALSKTCALLVLRADVAGRRRPAARRRIDVNTVDAYSDTRIGLG